MLTLSLAALLSAPAAASLDATFARPLVRFESSAFARDEEDALLELMRDRDPEVRRGAVRSLKGWMGRRESTRDRVLDVFKNVNEEVFVRREAAKTLSAVATDQKVSEALLREAKRGYDAGLRAISYKALYWAASRREDVRDAVLAAARNEGDPAVRLGAIWGLFAAVDEDVRGRLVEIGKRDGSVEARVEALKSLYGAMSHEDVRDLAYDLARETGTPPSVRRAAILMHATRFESRQADLLQAIAKSDRDPAMRLAAATALGDPMSDEIVRYFHRIRVDRHGAVVYDPIDAE